MHESQLKPGTGRGRDALKIIYSLLKTWSLGDSRRYRETWGRGRWLCRYKMIWNIGMLGCWSVEDPVFSGIGAMAASRVMLVMVVMACCLSR